MWISTGPSASKFHKSSATHRRSGRAWQVLAKLVAASTLPHKMAMSSSRAALASDMAKGSGSLVPARYVQDVSDERRLGSLPCSLGCRHPSNAHVPVLHPNAVLRGESPAAVAAGLPALAATTNTIPVRSSISGVWQCSQVVILQGASRHTVRQQCQGCVDVAKPQAEIKEMHQAPLRRHQFSQGFLAQGCRIAGELSRSSFQN